MELGDDITSYLRSDDVEGLNSLLTHPAVIVGPCCRHTLMQNLCVYGSVKCATSLLDGKLGMTADVNRDKLLHRAAWFMQPELVKLFLRYGARTDVQFATEHSFADVILPLNGMLPLNVALDVAREMALLGRDKSLFKGIVSLCKRSMKPALVVSKLLVESSGNIEKFAYQYAMEGKLMELAVVLIVAREKVLNGRMMIHQCVRNQILSLIDEEVKLTRECKHKELNHIRQKMMHMSSTALLLEIYERAGNSLEEYRQSLPKDVMMKEMEEDVALILKEAGFRLVDGGFEFSNGNWFGISFLTCFFWIFSFFCLYKFIYLHVVRLQSKLTSLNNNGRLEYLFWG